MIAQSQQAVRVSKLISGCISGLGSMVILGYLAKVTNPGIIEVMVALIFFGSLAAAYLCITRASLEPKWKSSIIFAAVAICCLYLRYIS
jgi:hypothetical protein